MNFEVTKGSRSGTEVTCGGWGKGEGERRDRVVGRRSSAVVRRQGRFTAEYAESAEKYTDICGLWFESLFNRKGREGRKEDETLHHRGHEGTQRNATEEPRVIWNPFHRRERRGRRSAKIPTQGMLVSPPPLANSKRDPRKPRRGTPSDSVGQLRHSHLQPNRPHQSQTITLGDHTLTQLVVEMHSPIGELFLEMKVRKETSDSPVHLS